MAEQAQHGQTPAAIAEASRRDVPEGFRLAATASAGWRADAGRPCRRMLPGHAYCRKPSAAAINRGKAGRYAVGDSWWAYCPDHLYGNWIEDGQVFHWRLEASDG